MKVYSLENCKACKDTIAWLEERGIDFSLAKIDEDDKAFDEVVELGYRKAPVVVAGKDHWSGFNLDKLKEATGAS